MTHPRNPVERRLDRLHDQWTEFAQLPEARMLVWQLESREASMVEAFWQRENDAAAAQTPDMFLRLDAPFENPAAHGYVLRESLIDQYRQASEALQDDPDVDATWKCPYAAPGADDIGALVRALDSFHAHHAEHIELLAVWLNPQDVPDAGTYLRWLQRLVHALPAHVRLFSADLVEAPAHEPLWRTDPTKVVPVRANLDMGGAMVEISRNAGDLETPGGQFRHLYVKLGDAATVGDLATALQLAERATTLARGAGWPHLAAAPQMMLAATQTGSGQFLEAAQTYTRVLTLADEAENAGEPAEGQDDPRPHGPRLRLQARLGQVGVLFQVRAYDRAAEAAMQAAKVAEQLGDTRAQLDALRLASFAYEQSGAQDHAWAVGMTGMGLVQEMDEETRKTSTAPYLAQGLLRLARTPTYEAHYDPLEAQVAKLLGADWRALLAPPPPAPRTGG